MLILAAVAGWRSLATSEPSGYDFEADPGPTLVPRILLALLAAGGAALVIHGLRAAGRTRVAPVPPGLAAPEGSGLLPAAFVLSLVLYLALLPQLGYRIVTFLFSSAWILALTRRERGRLGPAGWVAGLATGAAVTLALYLVFHGFVRVPLP